MNYADAAHAVDLRLRLTQVKHLVNMLVLRPELSGEIVPLIAEAADAPPAQERTTRRAGKDRQ